MYNLWGKQCWALSLHRYSDIWKDHIMHEIRTGIPDVRLYLLALQVTWVNKRLTSTLPYIVDLQTCIWKWHNYRKLCAALRCEFAAETRSCMRLCSCCDFFLNIYHWASSEVRGDKIHSRVNSTFTFNCKYWYCDRLFCWSLMYCFQLLPYSSQVSTYNPQTLKGIPGCFSMLLLFICINAVSVMVRMIYFDLW